MAFSTPSKGKVDEIRAARKTASASSISGVEAFATGLGEGLEQDPFIGFAIKGLRSLEGADPKGVKELEDRISGSTAAQAGRLIGEYGPTLLFGLGAYGGGFAAGRAGVQALAKQVALKDAVRTSLKGIGKGVSRSELSGGLQPARGVIKKSLDRTARKVSDRAGVRAEIQGTPGIQAAAERTGASLGIGSMVTGQELARGKSPTEALKVGAMAAAFTLGVDAALVGGTRALFRSSRSVDITAIKKNAAKKGMLRRAQDLVDREGSKVAKIRKKLTDVLDTDQQQRELEFFHGTRAARNKEILKTPEAQDLVRQLRATKSRKLARQGDLEREGVAPYLGQGPGSTPTPMGRLLNRLDDKGDVRAALTKLLIAPESQFGAHGEYANKFFTGLKRALVNSNSEEQTLEVIYSGWGKSIMRATGITSKEFKQGTGKNLDLAHAWEMVDGGPKGVQDLMKSWGRSSAEAEEVIAIFEAREALEKSIYLVRGKKIGAKLPMDLEQAGVGRWITHSSREIDTKEMVKEMVKSGNYTEADAYALIRARGSHMDPPPVDIAGIQTNQPVRNGPLEFNRVETGTTRDKIQRGIPLNPNVWDAGYQTARSAVRRIHTDPILGGAVNTEKGRVMGGSVDDIVALVEAEGGSGVKVRAIIEAMTGRTYYGESMRKWATAFTSIETAAKLPMAFLANATQPVLTTTWLGYKASLKGMFKIANKEDRVALAQAMNVHEHIGQALGHSLDQEGLALSSLEKLADYTLRFTGFTKIEKFNRIHGAAATQAMVRDRLARGSEDLLRGIRLDSSRKMFGEIGLDFDGMVMKLKDHKGAPEAFFKDPEYLKQEFNAMIQGAQKTQFFPGPTRTPALWKHPLARTMLQFKTFAVGQSRLIRDAVLTEYANGNMAPLATYLSAAPIAGEFVGDARAWIKGKDRSDSGMMRGLHNMSYIGGLGIVSDLFGAAQYHGLQSSFMGPGFSDLFSISEYMLTGEFGELRKMAQRQPAYQMGAFLMGKSAETATVLGEYLDSVGSDGESKTTIDLGQLLTNRVQNKR